MKIACICNQGKFLELNKNNNFSLQVGIEEKKLQAQSAKSTTSNIMGRRKYIYVVTYYCRLD